MAKISTAILGASGYVGGELLRLLLPHPKFAVKFVTSKRFAKRLITSVHPNLRGSTQLKFVDLAAIKPVDLVFSCLPHGTLAFQIAQIEKLARKKLIDCSADFRLEQKSAYEKWYKFEHPAPQELTKWVYGLPELHAPKIQKAQKIAVAGCTATSALLAAKPLLPFLNLKKLIFDLKVGSSGAGNKPTLGGHHPERANVLRSYKLCGHRHTAEVQQELNLPQPPNYAISSVPTVRGITCHLHAFLTKKLTDQDIWQIFRQAYGQHPFIRIIKEATGGPHSLPEAKILAGTNFCDLGWVLDAANKRLTVVTALDNLGKGAAGNALECANLAFALPRTLGLEFLGLHPV